MVMEFMDGGDLGGLLETKPKGKLKVDVSSPAIPGVFLKRKGEKVMITQTYVVVCCLDCLNKEGNEGGREGDVVLEENYILFIFIFD